ncbi:MAG: biopolymer transporter ExbD [Calditrichaeota bacterium]|nr:MAG: biopolymer transporter ExbD [Calditrichota bacterium]
MTRGGLIIRLIDVAMIILFGFIAISDIKVKAQIKLPAKDETPPAEQKEDPTLLFVTIGLDHRYTVKREDEIVAGALSLEQLEQQLLRHKDEFSSRGQEFVVLLEPDQDSPIQFTIDALDICERNGIPKNINYESMQF